MKFHSRQRTLTMRTIFAASTFPWVAGGLVTINHLTDRYFLYLVIGIHTLCIVALIVPIFFLPEQTIEKLQGSKFDIGAPSLSIFQCILVSTVNLGLAIGIDTLFDTFAASSLRSDVATEGNGRMITSIHLLVASITLLSLPSHNSTLLGFSEESLSFVLLQEISTVLISKLVRLLPAHFPSGICLIANIFISIYFCLRTYKKIGLVDSNIHDAVGMLSCGIIIILFLRYCYERIGVAKINIPFDTTAQDILIVCNFVVYLFMVVAVFALPAIFGNMSDFRDANKSNISVKWLLIVVAITVRDLLAPRLTLISITTEKAIEEKRKMVRYISHEVRSPLTVIHAGIEMLRDEAREGPIRDRDELLEDMFISSAATVDFLNEMLMIENIGSEKSMKNRIGVRPLSTFDISCVYSVSALAIRNKVSLTVCDDVQKILSLPDPGYSDLEQAFEIRPGELAPADVSQCNVSTSLSFVSSLVLFVDYKQIQRTLKSLVTSVVKQSAENREVVVATKLLYVTVAEDYSRYVRWGVAEEGEYISWHPAAVLRIQIKSESSIANVATEVFSMTRLKGGGQELTTLSAWVTKAVLASHGGSIELEKDEATPEICERGTAMSNANAVRHSLLNIYLPVFKKASQVDTKNCRGISSSRSFKTSSIQNMNMISLQRMISRGINKSPRKHQSVSFLENAKEKLSFFTRSLLRPQGENPRTTQVRPTEITAGSRAQGAVLSSPPSHCDLYHLLHSNNLLGEDEGKDLVNNSVSVAQHHDPHHLQFQLQQQQDQAQPTPLVPSCNSSLSFLLVDDSTMARKMIRRVVESVYPDAVITEADDGVTAWEAIEQVLLAQQQQQRDGQHRKRPVFDIILLDNVMVKMNGPQFAEKVKRELVDDNSPIIIGVTGNGLSEDIDDFLKKGADEVIVKPLSKIKLLAIVEKFSPLSGAVVTGPAGVHLSR